MELTRAVRTRREWRRTRSPWIFVAVLILGPAAGVSALPALMGNHVCYSKERVARRQLEGLTKLMRNWRAGGGAGCPAVADLIPRGASGRARSAARDPWGSPWQIRCSADGRAATILAPGMDRQLNTADDLVMHE